MNIAKAHAFCAKLPGATRDLKWAFGDSVHPVFSIGGKMFAMFTLKSDRLVDAVMFKAADARFLELTDRDGFAPAPYLAKAHWVRIEAPERVSDAEAKQLLTEAYQAVLAKLSKTMQRALADGTHRPAATKRADRKTTTAATKRADRTTMTTSTKRSDRTTMTTSTKRPTVRR